MADSVAVAERGADIEGDLLTIMNTVDGIFLWQVGAQIAVADIVLLDPAIDPFSATESSQLPDTLSAFKANTASLSSLGLVHLFTGRNIESPSNPQGVAIIDTVCDPQASVGITEFRASDGLVVEYLLATHEIGHNFGAPHDNEAGSVCAAAPSGFLMERQRLGDVFAVQYRSDAA